MFGPADHWGNLLGFDGAVALSRGLRGWPAPGCRLQVLTLRENRLGDGGVGALAEASGGLSEVFFHGSSRDQWKIPHKKGNPGSWISYQILSMDFYRGFSIDPLIVEVFMGKEIPRIFWSQPPSQFFIDRGLGGQCGPQRIGSLQQRGGHGLGLGAVGRASWGSLGLSENRVYPQQNSHLIGIMISKTIGFRGTLFSDTPIFDDLWVTSAQWSWWSWWIMTVTTKKSQVSMLGLRHVVKKSTGSVNHVWIWPQLRA